MVICLALTTIYGNIFAGVGGPSQIWSGGGCFRGLTGVLRVAWGALPRPPWSALSSNGSNSTRRNLIWRSKSMGIGSKSRLHPDELGAGVIAVPAIAVYLACVQCVRIDRICTRVCVTELHLSIYSSDVDCNTAAMFPVSVRRYSGRCSKLSRPHRDRATKSLY